MKFFGKKSTVSIFILCIVFLSVNLLSGCGQPDNTSTNLQPEPNIPGQNPTINSRDTIIGNGNYVFHRTFDKDADFSTQKNTVTSIDSSLRNEEKKYFKDKINDFINSLSNRPAAMEYYQDLITALQEVKSCFSLPQACANDSIDDLLKPIIDALDPYLDDMLSNISKYDDLMPFVGCFNILATETYERNIPNCQCNDEAKQTYAKEKKSALELVGTSQFNLKEEYGAKNFEGITNAMDDYCTDIAQNLGHDVTMQDVRNLVDIALYSASLSGLHDGTAGMLGYEYKFSKSPYPVFQTTRGILCSELAVRKNYYQNSNQQSM